MTDDPVYGLDVSESAEPIVGERWLACPFDTQQKSIFDVLVVDLHDGQFVCRLHGSHHLIPRDRMIRRTAKVLSLVELPKVGDVWFVEIGHCVKKMKLVAIGSNDETPYLFRELDRHPSEYLVAPHQLFARDDNPTKSDEERAPGIEIIGYVAIAAIFAVAIGMAYHWSLRI